MRFRTVSAPGLLFLVLTITFASIDWVMSLDPHWYSTIFGLLIVVGQGLSAFAFAIVGARDRRHASSRSPDVLKPRHFHDLGKLMLAFVMLWAYLTFSQFLIIWSGNLPEEIPWYLERMRGGWGVRRHRARRRALRPAVPAAAVAGPEEAAGDARARRGVHHRRCGSST